MGQNKLYPVFLKLSQFSTLIVGGGRVGEEKLFFILKSSPDARIHVIGQEISEEILNWAQKNHHITFQIKSFEATDVIGHKAVIAATNDKVVNLLIHQACQEYNVLVNVADTPELCDFYLGSIVTKGDLKIGISTNGQSPTFAKRFREMLEDTLPESIDGILSKLSEIRNRLSGDFQQKVQKLDEITDVLKSDKNSDL